MDPELRPSDDLEDLFVCPISAREAQETSCPRCHLYLPLMHRVDDDLMTKVNYKLES